MRLPPPESDGRNLKKQAPPNSVLPPFRQERHLCPLRRSAKNIDFFLFFINKYLLSRKKAAILSDDNIFILNHIKKPGVVYGRFSKTYNFI